MISKNAARVSGGLPTRDNGGGRLSIDKPASPVQPPLVGSVPLLILVSYSSLSQVDLQYDRR